MLVDSIESAEKAIALLKQHDVGQTTFIILSKMIANYKDKEKDWKA